MKKTIMALFVMVLTALMIAAPVQAEEEFVINSNGVLTAYNGLGGDVVIPDGVTEIGEEVFMNCYAMTSVTIPDSVTKIGVRSFYNCTAIKEVVIPEGVQQLCYKAFTKCSSLASVSLPDSLRWFEQWGVFTECPNLKTAGPSSDYDISFAWTNEIPGSAFYGCSSLTHVCIPATITRIGYEAFTHCYELRSAGNGAEYDVDFGWTTAIPDDAFKSFSTLQSVDIPSTVTSIGRDAFYGCDGLTSLQLPAGLTRIGSSAFEFCTGLTSLEIPDGVTVIESSLVRCCTSLASLKLPANLTEIYSSAFDSCRSLTSLDIPETVTSFGTSVFANCSSLTSITLPEQITYINTSLLSGCTSLTHVGFPCELESIRDDAFEGCTSLQTVELPASLVYIGQRAFRNCSALTTVIMNSPSAILSTNSFLQARKNGILFVPTGTVEQYQSKIVGTGLDEWEVLEMSSEFLEAPVLSVTSMTTDGINISWNDDSYEKVIVQCNADKQYLLTGSSFCDPVYSTMGQEYVYTVRGYRDGMWTLPSEPLRVVYNPFADVAYDSPSFEHVAWAYNHDIVGGARNQEDGLDYFKLENKCTRAQFSIMFYKLYHRPNVDIYHGLPFRDIDDQSANTKKAIVWLYNEGVVSGAKNDNTLFLPKGNIKRAHLAIMFYKKAGKPAVDITDLHFTDISSQTKTTKQAIVWCYQNHLIDSIEGDEFLPNTEANRALLTEMLYGYDQIFHLVYDN